MKNSRNKARHEMTPKQVVEKLLLLKAETWISVEDAAFYLDVCTRTIQIWIDSKLIPHRQWVDGGAVRINRVLLDQQDDSQKAARPRTGEPQKPGGKRAKDDRGVSLAAYVEAR